MKNKSFIIFFIAILAISNFNSIPEISAYSNFPLERNDAIIQDAISWLKKQQALDGSIGGDFSSNWVLRNIAYSGENPNEWRINSSPSLIEYVKSQAPAPPYNTDDAYKIETLILSLISAGEDPRSALGINWVNLLKTTPIHNNNQIGNLNFINDDCWGIIALIAADEDQSDPVIQDCIEFINNTKIIISPTEYAWAYNFEPSWISVDDTSVAIMALIAAGVPQNDILIQYGLNWLDSQQISSNGGFGFFGLVSADSTAFAIQAIIAAGENPNFGRWLEGTKSPIDAMLIENVTYNSETNAFGYVLENNFYSSEYSTGNALSALLGKAYPLFKGEVVNIRIEGESENIWNGKVFVASIFPKDEEGGNILSNPSSGHKYYIPTALGALDEASIKKPYNYTISKAYLPRIYISEINGHTESGSKGWNFRIDGTLPGPLDSGQAYIQSDDQEILWFYGYGTELVLKVEIDNTKIHEGGSITVEVTYYDQQGNSYPVGSSSSTGIFAIINEEQHQLNDSGHITIENLELGTEIYATGDGYVRSNKITIISSNNEENYPLDSNDVKILNSLQYLNNVQDANGSIGGFGTSCWATIAISSAGYNPRDWENSGNSVVSYLINNREQVDTNKVTDIAKFILAMTAVNENPRNIGGTDYISLLEKTFTNGQFGDESTYNEDFWAITALISAGKTPTSPLIQNTASYIKSNQNTDGGWGWHSDDSDVDDTAAAIIALRAAGEGSESTVITNAINYLKNQLDANGGFKFMGEANSASDSWGIMALLAANINPTSTDWTINSSNPISHLLSLQNADGSFSWSVGENGNAWWTSYAIPPLLGKTYPTNIISTYDQAYVRIEDYNITIWRGWISIPDAAVIECYNSNKEYNIEGNNVLAILDKASEIGGFSYSITDHWYPDVGFYVDSINNHIAEGEYGWMYRVNYIPGNVSMNNYNISSLDHIIIYWGTQDIRPLKLEVNIVEVELNQPFTVTVKYLDDTSKEWIPLEEAIIYANPEYITDFEGKVNITLTDEQVYGIYAAKWGASTDEQYITSDIVQVGVGVPIPEFSYLLPLSIGLIIVTLIGAFEKRNLRKI